MDAGPLKTITYRGGLVRFRIPANWIEEYEESGGGTFYEPGNDSGTLRLNILTFKGPADKPIASQAAGDAPLRESREKGVPVERLRESAALLRVDGECEEHGERLKIRYWRIAWVSPPMHFHMAIFSYTLLAWQFNDPAFAAELALLDRELRQSELARVL